VLGTACRALELLAGDLDTAVSKSTAAGTTGEFTSMLAEAQKMFSNISTPSSDLGNSVGNLGKLSTESHYDDHDDDDFLPPPPVNLYNAGVNLAPAPQTQPEASNTADDALAQNWLHFAGLKKAPAKIATGAVSASTGVAPNVLHLHAFSCQIFLVLYLTCSPRASGHAHIDGHAIPTSDIQ
jgi:hypothetical protein